MFSLYWAVALNPNAIKTAKISRALFFWDDGCILFIILLLSIICKYTYSEVLR
jgi:hypothetical protein